MKKMICARGSISPQRSCKILVETPADVKRADTYVGIVLSRSLFFLTQEIVIYEIEFSVRRDKRSLDGRCTTMRGRKNAAARGDRMYKNPVAPYSEAPHCRRAGPRYFTAPSERNRNFRVFPLIREIPHQIVNNGLDATLNAFSRYVVDLFVVRARDLSGPAVSRLFYCNL